MTGKKGQIKEGFFRGKKEKQTRKKMKKKESHHKKTMGDLQII